jgi:hypothetical protein
MCFSKEVRVETRCKTLYNGIWFVDKMVMRLNIDIASQYFNETLVKLISLIVEQNIKYRQYLLKYFDLKPV